MGGHLDVEVGGQQEAVLLQPEVVIDRKVRQVEEPVPHACVLPIDDADVAVVDEVGVQQVVVARHLRLEAASAADLLRDTVRVVEFRRD